MAMGKAKEITYTYEKLSQRNITDRIYFVKFALGTIFSVKHSILFSSH